MESEAVQGCLLKFGEDSTILRTIMETFVDWLANGIPPWADYRTFRSVRLIALDKQPGVRLVGEGETLERLFSKNMLRSQEQKQPWHVRMTSCVPDLRWELTAWSTEFKLFGTKT